MDLAESRRRVEAAAAKFAHDGGGTNDDRSGSPAGERREKEDRAATVEAVRTALAGLEMGEVRVASPPASTPPGAAWPEQPEAAWEVHPWLKQAILLAFKLWPMAAQNGGVDRLPLRRFGLDDGVRLVPPASVRAGAHVARGCVLMPSFVNTGAFVGAGSMVDTWATVGSCAQIGRDVHLSGGVGIGGVLEPALAHPTIIEDGAFVGSRVVVVEGVRVGARAVLGAGVVLTASTPVIDVTVSPPRTYHGHVPAGSVVIPGSRPRSFAGGTYQLPCALIVGRRSLETDRKVSLNQALREHAVAV